MKCETHKCLIQPLLLDAATLLVTTRELELGPLRQTRKVSVADRHEFVHEHVREEWADPAESHVGGQLTMNFFCRQKGLSISIVACDAILKRSIVRGESSHD